MFAIVKPTIWFEKDGIPTINKILLNHFNMNTKIGDATYKAIKNLMKELETKKKYKNFMPNEIIKDKKGREYLSFNDPDFQKALILHESGEKQYGGLIYVIEVLSKFYIGFTERTLDERFIEHIVDSMRYYILANGDIRNSGYGKLHYAVVFVLKDILCYDISKLYNEIRFLSYTNQYEKRKLILNRIVNEIEPYIKSRIIEIHYGSHKLSIREKYYTKNFPVRELYGASRTILDLIKIKEMDLKKDGLNMVYGGGGSGYISYPIYDIAIMVAMGLSAPKIAEILYNNYGIEYAEIRSVQERIADILGGAFRAQEELLRPIIEYLVKVDNINRHDIYLAFKKAEIINAWFSEWSYGREVLNVEIDNICEKFNLDPKLNWEAIEDHIERRERYYAGIPESKWLDWIFYNIPRRAGSSSPNTIQDETGLGDRKIKAILKVLCKKFKVNNKNELMYMLHKEKAIELINEGIIKETNIILTKENFFIKIYSEIFGFKDMYNAKYYFRNNLFKRMTLEEIWNKASYI